MTAPTPIRLEHVVALNMARLRVDRGWSQSDLAWRMRANGCDWTLNRVTQTETLRRPVTLQEVVSLAWVFEVPMAELVAGDNSAEFPDGRAVSLDDIRRAITGDTSTQTHSREHRERLFDRGEIRKMAKSLEVTPELLDWLARRLYGHSFVQERNERAGDLTGLPKRSAQTKRGHATRALVDEVRAYLDREGRDHLAEAYRTRPDLSVIPGEGDGSIPAELGELTDAERQLWALPMPVEARMAAIRGMRQAAEDGGDQAPQKPAHRDTDNITITPQGTGRQRA